MLPGENVKVLAFQTGSQKALLFLHIFIGKNRPFGTEFEEVSGWTKMLGEFRVTKVVGGVDREVFGIQPGNLECDLPKIA